MEKIIEIDLNHKEDLVEKYNKNKVSSDLINYLINATPIFNNEDSIKVIINNKIKGHNNCILLIKEGLQEEYNNTVEHYDQNNIKQLTFLIIGVITLLISVLVEGMVLKELASVGVWVLFWNVIEIELFEDKNIRKKRKILKKLLNSEFIEK